MLRRYMNCDNCNAVGNIYFSAKHDAGLCDHCLSLTPLVQRVIREREGNVALMNMIGSAFDKMFGPKKEEDKMNSVKFYGDYDEVSKRLDEVKAEHDDRGGNAFAGLRLAHQNKRAALLKAQIALDVAEQASREATSAFVAEQEELKKLSIIMDELSIQKKALFRVHR